MATFKDSTGREWACRLDADAFRRIREHAGIDLCDYGDASLIERLTTDPVLLCDVLYAICEPQAKTLGVTAEQFAEAMDLESVELASDAFAEAISSVPHAEMVKAFKRSPKAKALIAAQRRF